MKAKFKQNIILARKTLFLEYPGVYDLAFIPPTGTIIYLPPAINELDEIDQLDEVELTVGEVALVVKENKLEIFGIVDNMKTWSATYVIEGLRMYKAHGWQPVPWQDWPEGV